jgi:hypothetical protein
MNSTNQCKYNSKAIKEIIITKFNRLFFEVYALDEEMTKNNEKSGKYKPFISTD